MLNVLDPILEANSASIYFFGHGGVVPAVSKLVKLVRVPEVTSSQSSILWGGQQVRLHDQVYTQGLASMEVVC